MSSTGKTLDKFIWNGKDWDGALERLKSEKGKKEAKTTGWFGNLPLHDACVYKPPFEVVAALLEAHPEGANTANSSGMLPIHIACSSCASAEVVKALLEANPDGIKTENDTGKLPLHIALKGGAALEVVSMLLEAYPQATRHIDDYGKLPIHYVKKKDASSELVRQFFKAYAGKKDDTVAQRLDNAVQSLFQNPFKKISTQKLHHAVQSKSYNDVWQVLIEAYPKGAAEIDK